MTAILLVFPSPEQSEYVSEVTGGPSSGLGPKMWGKANCQEEKGENPLNHKVSFEQGRGVRDVREFCENAFQNQYSHKEESGTETYQEPSTFWDLSVTKKSLSAIPALTQIIKGKNSLSLPFPFILYASRCALQL